MKVEDPLDAVRAEIERVGPLEGPFNERYVAGLRFAAQAMEQAAPPVLVEFVEWLTRAMPERLDHHAVQKFKTLEIRAAGPREYDVEVVVDGKKVDGWTRVTFAAASHRFNSVTIEVHGCPLGEACR